jgi:ankyrin repeat protein
MPGGAPPLFRVVRSGNRQLLAELLRRGVNPDTLAQGTRPVLVAMEQGRKRAVSMLLEAGASVAATDSKGRTLLHVGLEAVHSGALHHSALVSILKREADPNAQDATGATPLHYAARWGLSDAAKQLVAYGANPKIKNEQGQNPIELAQASDHPEVAQQIKEALEHGADPSPAGSAPGE